MAFCAAARITWLRTMYSSPFSVTITSNLSVDGWERMFNVTLSLILSFVPLRCVRIDGMSVVFVPAPDMCMLLSVIVYYQFNIFAFV